MPSPLGMAASLRVVGRTGSYSGWGMFMVLFVSSVSALISALHLYFFLFFIFKGSRFQFRYGITIHISWGPSINYVRA